MCFLTAGIRGSVWGLSRRTTTPAFTSLVIRPNLWVPQGSTIMAETGDWIKGRISMCCENDLSRWWVAKTWGAITPADFSSFINMTFCPPAQPQWSAVRTANWRCCLLTRTQWDVSQSKLDQSTIKHVWSLVLVSVRLLLKEAGLVCLCEQWISDVTQVHTVNQL